jgi:deoxyadenosine/deoxycytidine kinase
MYIVVDGIISAGKTKFVEMIADRLTARFNLKVKVVKEPVDEWEKDGILKQYYSDVSRWGYLFQTNAFVTRVRANIEAYKSCGDDTVDVFLAERSNFSDRLFMGMLHDAGSITDEEMKVYRGWDAMWSEVMPYRPSLFIYLRPSVDTCMERIRVRNRDSESNITYEYQKALCDKHDEHLLVDGKMCEGTRTEVIANEVDYRDREDEKDVLLEQVARAIVACGNIEAKHPASRVQAIDNVIAKMRCSGYNCILL